MSCNDPYMKKLQGTFGTLSTKIFETAGTFDGRYAQFYGPLYHLVLSDAVSAVYFI